MVISWEEAPYGLGDLEIGAARGYGSATAPLRRGGEVRCCIRGCDQWIPKRSRGLPVAYCPSHGISVSTSPTYVYRDWERNFILHRDMIRALKKQKVESWRLGNETSEDAVSWNLFMGLAELGGLNEAFEALTGQIATGDPVLYFWGNEVWPNFDGRIWPRLNAVRDRLETGFKIPTEPDIIIRFPGQAIVLIEAKLGSPNGTLAKKKDTTPQSFLERYREATGSTGSLNRRAISAMEAGAILEQLCRNVVFSTHLAEAGETPFVANLVRVEAEKDVEARMARHLTPEGGVRFRRTTWEELGRLRRLQDRDADPLASYLKTKSLRLAPAFSSGPASGAADPTDTRLGVV